ncbi:hypothetical protein GOP47_0012081 [Adiantum capillus-veneris]|uniref:RING-type domain-containing protein n=1 Tax=Adiantum capillus-veneris TaxID=13818 RepID=A0A9D4UU01_ADICA|nr:hypothetical protein GOP47_0011794 [Adiantum capillus-veneris]KAI5074068.1 hypothetical protein GOP47_0012081 [Adiantum capillus-veneris]
MGLSCKICFESASSLGTSHARITPCGHVFCEPCAVTWFRSEAACPVCRHCVEGLSSLIPLYDQDAGLQSSPFESGDDNFVDLFGDVTANGTHSGVEKQYRDSSSLTARTPPTDCTTPDAARASEARSSSERESEGGQRRGVDDEDVQVRFVLGKVAERWQQVMVERAKLKVQVACLDKAKQDLLVQLQRLTEENMALREALNSRSWPTARRKPLQSTIMDVNKHHDHWEARRAGDANSNSCSRNGDVDTSLLQRFSFTEPPHMGWEVGPMKAFPKPPEKVLERLQASKWELFHTFAMHSGPVHGIAVNPSGNLVATASWDHVCKVYDVRLEEEVAVLSGHDHGLYAVKFSPSKRNVVGTVSSDRTCRLWNAENGECLCVLEGHTDEVNGLAFKVGTHFLATASDDMTSKIWDAETGVGVSDLKGHRHAVYGVCFQPQGHLVATASFDLTAKLWDPRTSESIHTFSGHLEDVIGVDFDSTGNMLATGSDDKTCRVWDLRTGNVLEVLEEHGGEVKRVVFSPFSRLLATTCGDTTVRLFDTATFQCQHILSSHSDHVFDVAWSPTADFLVTASHDHLWKLWLPKTPPIGYTFGSSRFSHL